VAVEVGPSQTFFYGYFQEIGTAFHPAQAFMRPAFDSMVRRAQAIVGQEAWAAIRRHLRIGGGPSSSRGNL
jgi:HK97 gp10 family phage protein